MLQNLLVFNIKKKIKTPDGLVIAQNLPDGSQYLKFKKL